MAEIQADPSSPACYCTVNTTQAGTYQLSITQAGQPVGCSPAVGRCLNPFTIQMLPGEPNLDNSYFLMPSDSSIIAGSSVSVAIFSRDLLGNAVSLGSILMSVTPSGGEPIACSIVQVSCKHSPHPQLALPHDLLESLCNAPRNEVLGSGNASEPKIVRAFSTLV